jgi:RNA polymerase sigma-70 factor (ECF subfamily)
VSEIARTLSAARDGDEAAFQDLIDPHRRGLLAHCYRMSGSIQDAEDMVQEALLRAWKGLRGFEGRSSFRTWIYRIATHATLDALRRKKARTLPVEVAPPAEPTAPLAPPSLEMHWLEPFPDALLPTGAPRGDAVLSQKQSISLAFLQALQKLPATQRAAVLLKDVVGMSASEVAELLETTPAATNSLVQRARATLEKASPPEASPGDEEIVQRYVSAWETSDVDALVTLLRDDARLSMPPTTSWFEGPEAIGAFLRGAVLTGEQSFRARVTSANGAPAVLLFAGEELIGAQLLDVRDSRIFEVVAFMEAGVLRFFRA